MKTPSANDHRSSLRVLCCFTAALAANGAHAQSITDGTRVVEFGMVGIALGQGARLNLVSTADPREVPPGPCKATLQFLDGQGSELLPAVQVDLGVGEATHAEMIRGRQSGRVQFRARALLSDPPNAVPPGPCAPVIATLEVIDVLTARTSLLVSPATTRTVSTPR